MVIKNIERNSNHKCIVMFLFGKYTYILGRFQGMGFETLKIKKDFLNFCRIT